MSGGPNTKAYSYLLSSDVGLEVLVRVNALERLATCTNAATQDAANPNLTHELSITCEIHNFPSISAAMDVNVSTRLLSVPQGGKAYWGQWLKFPIRYGDLCPTSRLVLTIEDVSNGQRVVVGGSSIPLFNRRGLLKIGPRKLTVWRGRRGDSAVRSTTPYKLASRTAFLDVLRKRLIRRVQERKLEQRRNAHAQMHNGKAERESGSQECAWLDAVSMDRVVELVRERATTHADPSHLKRLETMFPELNPDVRIAYDLHEEAYAKQTADLSSAMRDHFDPSSEAFGSLSPSDLHRAEALLPFLTVEFPEFPLPVVYHQKPCNPQLSEILPLEEKGRLFVLHDPEMIRESPIEHKLEKMALSGLSVGVGDKTLKPSVRERNLIEQILRSPTKRMTTEAKTLFWRFRYSIMELRHSLPKFLRCVDWSSATHAEETVKLMDQWREVDTADALELLSEEFGHDDVRAFAVHQLEGAEDSELQCYLLQLVQALRYEPLCPSELSNFLVRRCAATFELANFFFWFVTVETHDQAKGDMYVAVLKAFTLTLEERNPEFMMEIEKQKKLRDLLILLAEKSSKAGRTTKVKQEAMRVLMEKDSDFDPLKNLDYVRLPNEPHVRVTKMVGPKSIMFKSALAPMLCHFECVKDNHAAAIDATDDAEKAEPSVHRVIWKTGDDLRQDQLIMQMIMLMDRLTKQVNMDLKLTPYVILATSPEDGFMEFVNNSSAISSILAEHKKDIGKYLSTHNQSPRALAESVDVFVKSCAGYCVITYLLGVGDRHLDNLMMRKTGAMFHIDFGFIFGRDPKPFPPPMKFTKEMIMAMGGLQSPGYAEFRRYCGLAYSVFRKHASLILNLLSLMADAGIEGFGDETERVIVLAKVQEKFKLQLNDEQAGNYILELIDSSVNALFPKLVERIHGMAMYFK